MKANRALPKVTITKKGTAWVEQGHPWIYEGEVMSVEGEIENGCIADAVSEKGMIIDPSEEETALRRYILRRSDVSVLLCDKSKFGKTSLFNVAPLSDIDYLVTDACLSYKEAPVKRKIINV